MARASPDHVQNTLIEPHRPWGQRALLDEAPENFDLSDQVAHPNLCGFGKSVIQAALAGQVKELVLVNCCDIIRSAYDILKEFGNLDFLYLLDILHSQEGCSVQHARDQLLALAEAYGAYTQFDRAAFCRLPVLPGHRAPHRRQLGAKMGSHLFSLVEETMPLPVENATCANNRRVAPPADKGDFAALMEDYARCLLGQLPRMRMTDNTALPGPCTTPPAWRGWSTTPCNSATTTALNTRACGTSCRSPC